MIWSLTSTLTQRQVHNYNLPLTRTRTDPFQSLAQVLYDSQQDLQFLWKPRYIQGSTSRQININIPIPKPSPFRAHCAYIKLHEAAHCPVYSNPSDTTSAQEQMCSCPVRSLPSCSCNIQHIHMENPVKDPTCFYPHLALGVTIATATC